MKKFFIIGCVVFALLIGGGVVLISKLRSSSTPAVTSDQKHRITDPENVIPVADRPYMQIQPSDIHNLLITVNNLKKPATTAEYEVEYSSGTTLQGFQGSMPVSTVPTSTKPILLGTRSAGGATTYNENVTGGNILIKFSGGPESYTLKNDWRFIDNKAKDTQVSSADAKFQLTSPDLALQRVLIILNSPGYPNGLTGTPESDPYTLDGVAAIKGKGTLMIRANDAVTSGSIMGWDGNSWHEFPAKIDGKSLTADVDLMQLYIAVKK